MLKHVSPLPQAYSRIVAIYTEPVPEPVEREPVPEDTFEGEHGVPNPNPTANTNMVPLISPTPQPELVAPQPEQVSPQPELVSPIDTSTLPTQTIEVVVPHMVYEGGLRSNNPFAAKPVVFGRMNEQDILNANPTVTDEFLKERQTRLQLRDSQLADLPKTTMQVVVPVIPTDMVAEQKRKFDEQQAALRELRKSNTVAKKADVEQPLPKADDNAQPQALVSRSTTLVSSSEVKQIADMEQTPQAVSSRPIESLSVAMLRQLCVKRGIAIGKTNGAKPKLIALLQAAGINSI